MNRIDLSAHTHIEDMDGVRYVVTTLKGVHAEWSQEETGVWIHTAWRKLLGLKGTIYEDYPIRRILLTDVAPVYGYVEGEPWFGVWGGHWSIGMGRPGNNLKRVFHRRVAIVCDRPDQFQALFEELKEARDHAE